MHKRRKEIKDQTKLMINLRIVFYLLAFNREKSLIHELRKPYTVVCDYRNCIDCFKIFMPEIANQIKLTLHGT